MKNVLSIISLSAVIIILGISLNGCSGEKNSNQDLSYVEWSNTNKVKEDGVYYFYYDGKPFTGFIVDLYNTNKAVSRLSMVNNGQLTGVTSKHGGTKTIGQITTINGMQYRLPSIEEEVKTDKDLVYYEESEQIKVDRAGYLKKNQSGRYEFVKDGVSTYYNKDGSVEKTEMYAEDMEID
ncbi:MAG: Uncharacterised protein [Bacteroidia bacterium]|jgi:hypothetical protein|nr:MAG: Uncharacterised protein [Bacteroidia bacterium]